VKTVVVTGASRGLGAGIAQALSQDGLRVVGLSRLGSRGPDGVDIRACDVGVYASVAQVLADVARDTSLFGLVNAAGIASMNLAISTPSATVQRIIQTNLVGTINCCIVLAKRFARNKNGRIINFSTIAVPLALKGESIYVASKAGVEGFSRSFAREMSDFATTVNVVAPGPIDTDLIAAVPQAAIGRIVDRQIMTRRFDKSDVVDLVRFLLSEQSRMISGQIFNVGGV
jgi:3-oxoacyl-[acyl-carrier protein] reductase